MLRSAHFLSTDLHRVRTELPSQVETVQAIIRVSRAVQDAMSCSRKAVPGDIASFRGAARTYLIETFTARMTPEFHAPNTYG